MNPVTDVTVSGEWLKAISLQSLFDLLLEGGGEAMVAGGAVRNALFDLPILDVDIATTLLPDEVVRRLEARGFKAIPTGIEHGTVTAILDGASYEVTTLREDIETDGRHAVVRFGTDWMRDAQRRDLTINALYCDRDGKVFDFVGGLPDIASKSVRFVGEASERVKEDALRMLRFFRFFAYYGSGRPDASGLKACNKHRDLLGNLSAERVWAELKKMLGADNPSRALLWMRTANVLAEVLPESAKWGIDAIPVLIELEDKHGWGADPMLRLAAMIRPNDETIITLADRLTLSNAERQRLLNWARVDVSDFGKSWSVFEQQLYRADQTAAIDKIKLEVCALMMRGDDAGKEHLEELVARVEYWDKPEFPVRGADLLETGVEAGPQMGERLKALEQAWVESGFTLSKTELLDQL